MRQRDVISMCAGLALSIASVATDSGAALARGPLAPNGASARATVRQLSLIAITANQLTQAREKIPGARLFEVDSAIRAQDIAAGVSRPPFVYSDFAAPGNDVTYLTVSSWFTSQGQRTKIDAGVSYSTNPCATGTTHPGCSPTTGTPEPRQRHLPLSGWKIDIGALLRVLQKQHYVSAGYSTVTITTAGRASATLSGPIATLTSSQSVILVREATAPRYHFMFLNATTGAVLEKGTALAQPPPA